MGLRLSLLGSPQLERDGVSLTIGRQKAFALLSYLAVTKQIQRRETLVAFFWPDVDPKLAYSYLRRDLTVLNKVLGTGWLNIDRYEIGIVDRDDFWLDISQFKNALDASRTHGHQVDEICSDCMTLLHEAVNLYRGDFLAGLNLPDSFEFDEWKTFESQNFRTDLTWVLSRLIFGYSAQGKFDDAIFYTRRWLRIDPFHEPAHRQLMQLYAWRGDWSAAQHHYDEYQRVLSKELSILPEESTQQLYQLIIEKKVQEPPVWQSSHATRYATPRNNLPSQLTPFVGRREELEEVKRYLLNTPACRMLTLVGPGGIGKTRLALQAATQLLEGFKNGVFWVSLEAVDSVEQLIPTIADSLSLTFQGRQAPKAQLLNYLREKQLLLLLDNFEHLIGSAGFLSELLLNTTEVKLLITSRERLNISPEWVHNVLGLNYPDVDREMQELKSDVLDANSVKDFGAVQLLFECAKRINPHLSLTPEEISAAVQICQLLQGIPLGIELASSWTRIMPFEEIAREIKHNLDFLAGSTRDAPDRHGSLRAVFDQSWRYLSEDEKNAYQKLSLFRGGFHHKAAEQIFDIPLSLLAELTDKSLIHRTSSDRYNLHEFSRQYAEEKLDASTENIMHLKDRHSAYFAAFLEEKEKKLKVGGSPKALSEIGTEIENIRLFWHWAVSQGRMTDIGKGLESLHHFYFTVGRVKEGEEVFREASSRLKSILDNRENMDPFFSLVYGRLLSREARFAYRLGSHHKARELAYESLRVLNELDEGNSDILEEKAVSLFYLSVILRGDGEYQAAESTCKESLGYFEKIQDQAWIATTQKQLGIIAGSQGNYELSRQWLTSARNQYQSIEDVYGLADTLNDLGNIAIGLGDLVEAKRLNQNCLVLRQKTNHQWGIATSLNNLGYIALVQEEFNEARQLLEKSLDIQREIGDIYQIANSLSNLGQAAYGQSDLMAARSYYMDALGYAMKIGAQPLLLEIIVGVVQIDSTAGFVDSLRAVTLLEFVRQHPACDRMTKQRADIEFARFAESMPAAGLTRAGELIGKLELETLVQEILG